MDKSKGLFILWLVMMVMLLPVQPRTAERPVQSSLISPIQIFPTEDDITLFRLNLIYGRNSTVTGLDMGLINHTTSGLSKGLQWGLVSLNDTDYTGWQYSGVNVTKGNFKGFQWGFINYANSAKGFQLGFINYAESMYGLQIGFANIIRRGGVLPVLPLVNFSF